MNIEWKLQSEELYPLEYRKVAKRTYLMPDGTKANFDVVVGRPVAAIVAITTDQKVVMTKQYRPGQDKVLLELPAGIIDEGESPGVAAGRELLEETGYQGQLKLVSSLYRDAYATTILYAFVATDCTKVAEPRAEPYEFIEVVLLSIPDFIIHVRSGQLTDVGPAYMALDYLKLLCHFDF